MIRLTLILSVVIVSVIFVLSPKDGVDEQEIISQVRQINQAQRVYCEKYGAFAPDLETLRKATSFLNEVNGKGYVFSTKVCCGGEGFEVFATPTATMYSRWLYYSNETWDKIVLRQSAYSWQSGDEPSDALTLPARGDDPLLYGWTSSPEVQ